MIYRKNIPVWERIARVGAGLLMVACGVYGPGVAGTSVGVVIAGTGVITLLTGFIGFCPACAMAGRKPESRER